MALIPRIVLGKNNLNEMVIQSSLEGQNVFSITDPAAFAFNSNWGKTGIIHEVGIKTGFDTKINDGPPEMWGSAILFNALPYRPQIVLGRIGSDGRINWNEIAQFTSGGSRYLYSSYYVGTILTNGFIMYGMPSLIPSPQNFIYIIFKTPVPGFV